MKGIMSKAWADSTISANSDPRDFVIPSLWAAYLVFAAEKATGLRIPEFLYKGWMGLALLRGGPVASGVSLAVNVCLWTRFFHAGGCNLALAVETLHGAVAGFMSRRQRGPQQPGDGGGSELRHLACQAIVLASHVVAALVLPYASVGQLAAVLIALALLPAAAVVARSLGLWTSVAREWLVTWARSVSLIVRHAALQSGRRSAAYVDDNVTRIRHSLATRGLDAWEYEPLRKDARQIRLLELHPPHPSGVVHSRIVTRSLEEASTVGYEAVSYRWKGPYNCAIVLLGDSCGEKDRRMWVMSTVGDLLRHLQLPDANRLLWIDSICNWQSNDKEMEWQLEMMRDIFDGASRVVGWLGGPESSASSSGAISILRSLPHTAEAEARILTDMNPADGIPRETAARWESVVGFLRNDWFCRVWMVQEVACARELTIVLGDEEIEWDDLVRSINTIIQDKSGLRRSFFIGTGIAEPVSFDLSFDWAISHGLTNILAMASIRDTFKQGNGVSPCFLLRAAKKFNATVCRDKVYGLRGLSWPEFPPVDLDKPDRSVILDACKTALLRNDLTILVDAGCGYGLSSAAKTLRLPSWCPDLFAPTLGVRRIEASDKYPYCAATHLECLLREEEYQEREALGVRGTLFDEIERLGQVAHAESYHRAASCPVTTTLRFYRIVSEAREIAKALAKRNPYPFDGEEALWRTVTGDYFLHRPDQTLAAVRSSAEDFLGRVWRGKAPGLEGFFQSDIEELLCAVGATMTGNRLCRTRSGRLGVAPPEARVGDEIAILWGATDPFVLRRSTALARDAEKRPATAYTLVGKCYVQGVMMGELRGRALKPKQLLLV
ncbi:heterokaryon incompatibility protein-domain-containing protein [Schizothecium vesticola]|uniref:Heterokaryon incompatibility protein-domain-containing protein n=1 Tax=Schizothecium vesticola TaxID=314040 RepID=A0AA40F407_9PEZI|nr:heterokaryon incompatibility protein-domain-containing protein [Schizothecium vesticola]